MQTRNQFYEGNNARQMLTRPVLPSDTDIPITVRSTSFFGSHLFLTLESLFSLHVLLKHCHDRVFLPAGGKSGGNITILQCP